jgi:hypothetical protein
MFCVVFKSYVFGLERVRDKIYKYDTCIWFTRISGQSNNITQNIEGTREVMAGVYITEK